MKGLRIELSSEALDISAGKELFGTLKAHTYCKIFKPFDHVSPPIRAESLYTNSAPKYAKGGFLWRRCNQIAFIAFGHVPVAALLIRKKVFDKVINPESLLGTVEHWNVEPDMVLLAKTLSGDSGVSVGKPRM
jgi:hypothetical protein